MGESNKYLLPVLAVAVVIIAIAGIVLYINGGHTAASASTASRNGSAPNPSTNQKIQIIAAENFWGSLMQQLGGTHVNVTSIVTDPNADPA